MEKFDIAIIGGGPAGIMAAIAASRTSDVILLEKNTSLGRKLLMTGGGRCNITNNKPIKQLLTFFNNKNFLRHSFYTFTNEDLFSWLHFFPPSSPRLCCCNSLVCVSFSSVSLIGTMLPVFCVVEHYENAIEYDCTSILAWRIPGMGEPAGLPSMGLHRVGHD